jgi:hypothetical protein
MANTLLIVALIAVSFHLPETTETLNLLLVVGYPLCLLFQRLRRTLPELVYKLPILVYLYTKWILWDPISDLLHRWLPNVSVRIGNIVGSMYRYCVIDMIDVVREVCVAATSFVVESPTKPQEIGNGDVKIVRTLVRSHVETRRREMTTTSTYIPWYIVSYTVLYAYRMCIGEELDMLYKLFQITSPIFIYFVCRETLLDVTLKYFITPSRDDRETEDDVTEGGESDATSEAVRNAISAANAAGVEDSHDDVSWINELIKLLIFCEQPSPW